jgi:hypothetical protein
MKAHCELRQELYASRLLIASLIVRLIVVALELP